MSNKKVIMTLTTSAAIAATIFAAEEAEAATYKVNSGDSLWKIAQKYNTTVPKLKSINNLTSNIIYINQKIETNGTSKKASSSSNKTSNTKSSSSRSNSTYTVKSGDTLSGIASKHKMSLPDLMKMNNLNTTLIFPGNELKVKKGTSTSSSSTKHTSKNNSNKGSSTYKVKSGNTLSQIAASNGVSVANLKNWNNLRSDLIYVGQTLKIKGGTVSNSSSSPKPSKPKNTTSQSSKTYVVKSGDSLSKIGSQYGVSVANLKSVNNLKSDIIYIGQKLRLSGKANTGSSSSNDSSSDSKVSESTSYNVSTLINEAKKYQGVPYVWGGQSPSGFDCSGFIHYIYNKAGLSAGRTNTGGYYNRSRMINNPQAGDLVFFEGTYKSGISHMGVYLGGGNFIHAGTSSGVTISNVSGPYWKDHFHSYKRFY